MQMDMWLMGGFDAVGVKSMSSPLKASVNICVAESPPFVA